MNKITPATIIVQTGRYGSNLLEEYLQHEYELAIVNTVLITIHKHYLNNRITMEQRDILIRYIQNKETFDIGEALLKTLLTKRKKRYE